MKAQVCLSGKFGPMRSPIDGVNYVLTLSCGHLYRWKPSIQGDFPSEVDCNTCDRPPIDWLGLLAL